MKSIKRLEEIEKIIKRDVVPEFELKPLRIEKQSILLALEDVREVIHKRINQIKRINRFEKDKNALNQSYARINELRQLENLLKQSEKFTIRSESKDAK